MAPGPAPRRPGPEVPAGSFLPYGRQDIDADDVAAVVEALGADFLTTGPRVEAFEQAFAAAVDAAHAVACANGTAALHLSMLALGIGPGDRVAVPAEEGGDALTAFSFVPGLTDTAMQAGLREVDEERFPMVGQFRRWHERGASKDPALVAEALELALALPREELQGRIVEADPLLKRR